MLIEGFSVGPWATNCYVVAAGPGEPCVIIDPGQGAMPRIRSIVEENKLAPAAVFLTHGHIDHVWSVAPVSKSFDVPAVIHRDDRYRLVDPAGSSFSAAREQLLAMTQDSLELTEPETVVELDDSVPLEFAGLRWHVRHAPGHTEGSVVFDLANDEPTMFSGDVLFAGSIGRTDLPGGSPTAMARSLRTVIATSNPSTIVHPGHGESTTIARELASNPFLVELEGGLL